MTRIKIIGKITPEARQGLRRCGIRIRDGCVYEPADSVQVLLGLLDQNLRWSITFINADIRERGKWLFLELEAKVHHSHRQGKVVLIEVGKDSVPIIPEEFAGIAIEFYGFYGYLPEILENLSEHVLILGSTRNQQSRDSGNWRSGQSSSDGYDSTRGWD